MARFRIIYNTVMRNAAVIHLGCPKNLTLSEEIAGRLARLGYRLTTAEEAHLCVVNSCGFIREAKEETIRRVLELGELKRKGKLRKIIFTGCMAEAYREELRSALPEIDEIVAIERIPEVLGGEGGRKVSTPGYAYLKIAEGCDHECAFCIIPRLTGPYRSRPRRDLVREARDLEAQGARELVLVAQDTTRYGRDLPRGGGLTDLVRDLLRATTFPWIRLLYLYPETLPRDLLRLMREEPRLLPYFDLPFQHASGRLLRRMRRGGGSTHFLNAVRDIRKHVPNAVFRSTFIVGFPGETESDVRTLETFLKAARLDHAGFFLYSDEPESLSHGMDRAVSRKEAARRLRTLAAVQREISFLAHRRQVGRVVPVLIEESGAGAARGRTAGMAPEVDGHVRIRGVPEGSGPGSLIHARIARARPYSLEGRWHEAL
jgi:ribosomal protein S12 methylthiotransferase